MTNPDFSYAAMPRQLESARVDAMGNGTITTTYTPLDDDTELVSWVAADGTGTQWKQRWPGGLAAAPKIGEKYRVLHDEWLADPETGEEYFLRIIHRWELAAVSVPGEQQP